MLLGQALHQVGSDIEVAGTQRLLYRLVQQALLFKPATGTQLQTGKWFAGLPAAQQVGEQVMVAEPVAMLVQRHQKHLVRLQETQHSCAVLAATQGVAQRGAEALLAGRVVQERLYVGGQHVDDFFKKVVADQAFAAM